MYMVCLEVSSSELYSPVKTDSSKTLKGKYCNKTTSKCCQQPWISLYHHVSNKPIRVSVTTRNWSLLLNVKSSFLSV